MPLFAQEIAEALPSVEAVMDARAANFAATLQADRARQAVAAGARGDSKPASPDQAGPDGVLAALLLAGHAGLLFVHAAHAPQ